MASKTAQETLAIPAKPAAITAANATVLTALGVAATGLVGAVVAGAVLTGTGVAIAKSKGTKRSSGMRAPRSSSTRLGGTPSRRSNPILGKLGSLKRSPVAATQSRKPSSLKNTAAKIGSSKLGAPLISRARALGKTPTGKRLASLPSTSKRAASKATGWALPKIKSSLRKAVTGGSGKEKRSGKWGAARTFFQQKILRRKPKKPQAQVNNVGNKVNGLKNPQITPTHNRGRMIVVRKAGKPVHIGTPSTAHHTGGKAMSGIMRNHAAQAWVYAGSFNPRGFLEVVDEIHDLPDFTSYVASAVGAIMATGQRRWPLDQAIIVEIGKMVQALHDAASIANRLPVMVEDIHKADLDRLRTPRQGEEMMDLANNGR